MNRSLVCWAFSLCCAGPLGASWSSPCSVSEVGGGSVCDPQIAVDSNGNVTAVWVNFGETYWSIQSSTKPNGGSWQETPDVLSAQDHIPTAPQIAVDPSGNTVVVWVEKDSVIRASARPCGGGWQRGADTLSSSELPATFSQLPHVVIDANGNATAVWKLFDGNDFIIQASSRPYGGVWQTVPDAVSGEGAGNNCPQAAVDSRGNAVAVWQQNDGSNLLINVSQKPFEGSWQDPSTAISQRYCDSVNPQVAADANGNVTAVWECCLDGAWGIQSSTKPVNGSWTDPVTISTLTEPRSFSQAARLAIDGDGNATAVWVGYSESGSSIQSSSRPYGGVWQAVPDVLSLENHDVTCPNIGVDFSGNMTAVWMDLAGYGMAIAASAKPYGGSWQSSPDILSAIYKNAGSPQLASSPDGTATVVWRESDWNYFEMPHPSAIMSSTYTPAE